MKNQLIQRNVQCPYCWETIEVMLDCSIEQQSYIEDCQVCCRPIVFDIMIGYDDTIQLTVKSEDD